MESILTVDHHVGIGTHVNTTDINYCSDTKAYFESVFSTYDLHYSPRYYTTSGTGYNESHFYTGTKGIRSWEFNIYGCSFDEFTWDICGCIAANNDEEYEAIYGGSCTKSTVMEPY